MDHLTKTAITVDYFPKAVQHRSEQTIADLLLVLRRRKKQITITTAACFLLGIIACLISTPKFEGKGVLEIQKTSADMLGLQNMIPHVSDGPGDALNANLDLQTKAEILQSNSLALKVIEELHLDKTRDFQSKPNLLASIVDPFSLSTPADPVGADLENSPERRTRALKIFAAHLKVEPISGTRLIEIRYFHSDRRVAPAVVNQLIRALKEHEFQARYVATTESSEWLNGQLTDLKKQTEDLQARVVSLQKDSGVYSMGPDSQGRDQAYSATLDRLQQATTALTAATSNRITKAAVYRIVRDGNAELISGLAGASLTSASPAVQNSFSLLQTLRSQQAGQEAQLAQDSSKFGTDYPKLADERASLQTVTKAISEEVSRIGERAANDFRASQQAEQSLNTLYVQRKKEAQGLNDKAIEYGIARQEADDSRSLYEDLFKRLKEAGVIEGLRSSNIAVVEPGREPARPANPNVPIYLGISVFGGLLFGVCGALFTESIDTKVQSFESVEKLLEAPLWAILPKFGKSTEKWLPSFAESLGTLRTKLLHSRSATSPKVVLVTSSLPGEGKSTVSAHLASMLARSGKRVLLVEADMRNPSLGKEFDSSIRSINLGILLTDSESNLEDATMESLPGMQVLRAGPTPPFPVELLDSERMRNLLNSWRMRFDHIVLDSPPILLAADATVLSQMADVTLLVARPGLTSSKALKRAYALIEAIDETQVGVVLNAVDRKSASYSDYYGHSGSTYSARKKGKPHAA